MGRTTKPSRVRDNKDGEKRKLRTKLRQKLRRLNDSRTGRRLRMTQNDLDRVGPHIVLISSLRAKGLVFGENTLKERREKIERYRDIILSLDTQKRPETFYHRQINTCVSADNVRWGIDTIFANPPQLDGEVLTAAKRALEELYLIHVNKKKGAKKEPKKEAKNDDASLDSHLPDIDLDHFGDFIPPDVIDDIIKSIDDGGTSSGSNPDPDPPSKYTGYDHDVLFEEHLRSIVNVEE